ncbi:MAG: hypothetical protein LIO56_00575 [Lachnospiraceae bacterium]|nr:hypothetical protein [Lachnospiraceae bacterium]
MNKVNYRLFSGKYGARFEIRTLMRQTAKVFHVAVPKTAGLSAPELLKIYAKLTADAAMCAIKSGQDLKSLQKRLYRMACRLGSGARRWLRPKNEQDCLAILTMLYRNLGIEIREEKPGEFCVYKCYFSSFYTPEICCVISAIDKGIFAGIYAGGRLTFRQRITEGKDVCWANFR